MLRQLPVTVDVAGIAGDQLVLVADLTEYASTAPLDMSAATFEASFRRGADGPVIWPSTDPLIAAPVVAASAVPGRLTVTFTPAHTAHARGRIVNYRVRVVRASDSTRIVNLAGRLLIDSAL